MLPEPYTMPSVQYTRVQSWLTPRPSGGERTVRMILTFVRLLFISNARSLGLKVCTHGPTRPLWSLYLGAMGGQGEGSGRACKHGFCRHDCNASTHHSNVLRKLANCKYNLHFPAKPLLTLIARPYGLHSWTNSTSVITICRSSGKSARTSWKSLQA